MNARESEPTLEEQHGVRSRSSSSGFADAFARRHGLLKRVIAGMGLDRSAAEDILQQVFVELLERPGEYRGPEDSARWLVRVTMNFCLLEFRRRKRFRRAAGEILRRRTATETAQPDAEESLIHTEQLELVRKTLVDLDDTLLAPLALRYFSAMTSSQIGEILQLNASTVRSRLREARMVLAKRLLKRGVGP